ncbi:hypothetical protein FDECE_11426 [Fusarium decemcellulare]|nr:hypothetical protein FDECE_11426 [Fusarium decemcellulare]
MLMLKDQSQGAVREHKLLPDFPMVPMEWTPHPEFGQESSPKSDDVFFAQVPNKEFRIELGRIEASSAGLGEGLPSQNSSTAFYSVSWTHQLHCLGLIKDAMWDLLRSRGEILTPLALDAASDDADTIRLEHVNHCFDYLHQSVTCCADMTIESRALDDKDEPHINGYGSVHQCKDLEAVSRWLQFYQPS